MTQEGWKLEQEEPPCTPPALAPSLCSNNCGFFGSAATMNLCSSCYKTLILLKPKPPTQIPPILDKEERKIEPDLPSSSPPTVLSTSVSPSSSSVAVAEPLAMADAENTLLLGCEKGQPLRCLACQKKVGLRGFKCRCGDVFCATHRYSDKHVCSFDHKAAGRAAIAKANPVVKAEKLNRI